ncbi:hypothetical protein [Salinibacterium sp. TMP30]|uniref:hypothetical protein n=1 Tax=Salinibacterium sp. TMP30 TaxID=3138237 RepID=UPI0031387C33
MLILHSVDKGQGGPADTQRYIVNTFVDGDFSELAAIVAAWVSRVRRIVRMGRSK